jgi:hypothetical protein
MQLPYQLADLGRRQDQRPPPMSPATNTPTQAREINQLDAAEANTLIDKAASFHAMMCSYTLLLYRPTKSKKCPFCKDFLRNLTRPRAVALHATPALVILRDGALGRQQMFAVPSWHRRRLPSPRLHHRSQVGAGCEKVLAHTHPSRVSRNHRGIDAGPSGHVFQKAGNLSCFEGRRLCHAVLSDRSEHRAGGEPTAVQLGPQGRSGPRRQPANRSRALLIRLGTGDQSRGGADLGESQILDPQGGDFGATGLHQQTSTQEGNHCSTGPRKKPLDAAVCRPKCGAVWSIQR